MNPYMFEQAKKSMNPETMKSMTSMFSSMSDEQIRSYTKMAGLGDIDPNVLRNSANMMKNMKDDDYKNIHNQVLKLPICTCFFVQAQNSSYNEYQSKTEQFKKQAAQQAPQQGVSNIEPELFPHINKLKLAGNEAFKLGQYEEASSKYLEAILEIEDTWDQNQYIDNDPRKKKELITLEVSCRLNYCNVKAKTNEFDIVKQQALKVLKKEENGKGYYRLGQALHSMKNYEGALPNLEKAIQLLPNDQSVKQLYNEVRSLVSSSKPEESKKQEDQSKSSVNQSSDGQQQLGEQKEVQKTEKQVVQDEPQKQTEQVIQDQGQGQGRKKNKVKLESVDTNSEEFKRMKELAKKKEEEEEVIIEEEKQQQVSPPAPPTSRQTSAVPQVDPEQFNQFKNMNPEQIKQMTSMMKGMDRTFLRQMMKQQTGQEMSDQQLDMMLGMLTPEMIQSMQNMNPEQITKMQQSQQSQSFPQVNSQPTNTTSTKADTPPPANSNMPPPTPDMSAILKNPAMIEMMMDQLKNNPQMLKTMSSMLGNGHPLSGYIERSRYASPDDLKRLVGYLQKFVFAMMGIYKGYMFMKQYWLVWIGILLAYIYFTRGS